MLQEPEFPSEKSRRKLGKSHIHLNLYPFEIVTMAEAIHSQYDSILILDFGSQYSHLIARRCRELNVYCEMLPCTQKIAELDWKPKGVILSGSPFSVYDDVAPIWAAIKEFMTTYVGEYYASDEVLANDPEIKAWVVEANGPAEAYDFPSELTKREDLIALLTHVAYLAGIEHHALNTNSPAASWPLPLHPSAHWQPLPTEFGVC